MLTRTLGASQALRHEAARGAGAGLIALGTKRPLRESLPVTRAGAVLVGAPPAWREARRWASSSGRALPAGRPQPVHASAALAPGDARADPASEEAVAEFNEIALEIARMEAAEREAAQAAQGGPHAREEGLPDPRAGVQLSEGELALAEEQDLDLLPPDSFLGMVHELLKAERRGRPVFPPRIRAPLLRAIAQAVRAAVARGPLDDDALVALVQEQLVEHGPRLVNTHEQALDILFPYAPALGTSVRLKDLPGRAVVSNRSYEDLREATGLPEEERERCMTIDFDCEHPSMLGQRVRARYMYSPALALAMSEDDEAGLARFMEEHGYAPRSMERIGAGDIALPPPLSPAEAAAQQAALDAATYTGSSASPAAPATTAAPTGAAASSHEQQLQQQHEHQQQQNQEQQEQRGEAGEEGRAGAAVSAEALVAAAEAERATAADSSSSPPSPSPSQLAPAPGGVERKTGPLDSSETFMLDAVSASWDTVLRQMAEDGLPPPREPELLKARVLSSVEDAIRRGITDPAAHMQEIFDRVLAQKQEQGRGEGQGTRQGRSSATADVSAAGSAARVRRVLDLRGLKDASGALADGLELPPELRGHDVELGEVEDEALQRELMDVVAVEERRERIRQAAAREVEEEQRRQQQQQQYQRAAAAEREDDDDEGASRLDTVARQVVTVVGERPVFNLEDEPGFPEGMGLVGARRAEREQLQRHIRMIQEDDKRRFAAGPAAAKPAAAKPAPAKPKPAAGARPASRGTAAAKPAHGLAKVAAPPGADAAAGARGAASAGMAGQAAPAAARLPTGLPSNPPAAGPAGAAAAPAAKPAAAVAADDDEDVQLSPEAIALLSGLSGGGGGAGGHNIGRAPRNAPRRPVTAPLDLGASRVVYRQREAPQGQAEEPSPKKR